MIDQDYEWQVGGMEFDNSATVKDYYESEIKKQTGYEETMPIGLMYVSDFGYAISPEDWDKAMSTEYSRVNWLFGGYDWFISPNTGDFGGAYSVDRGTDGTVSPQYVNSGNELPSNDIRPTFYLNSDVQYVSGDGSQQNPYRIA